jgi:hypothetical protein
VPRRSLGPSWYLASTTRKGTDTPKTIALGFKRALIPLDGSMVAEAILPQFLRMAHALSMDVALIRVVADGRTGLKRRLFGIRRRGRASIADIPVSMLRAPVHCKATMRVTEFSTGKSYTRSKKLYSTALVRSHRDAAWLPDLLNVVRKRRGTFSAFPRAHRRAGRHGTDLREL